MRPCQPPQLCRIGATRQGLASTAFFCPHAAAPVDFPKAPATLTGLDSAVSAPCCRTCGLTNALSDTMHRCQGLASTATFCSHAATPVDSPKASVTVTGSTWKGTSAYSENMQATVLSTTRALVKSVAVTSINTSRVFKLICAPEDLSSEEVTPWFEGVCPVLNLHVCRHENV